MTETKSEDGEEPVFENETTISFSHDVYFANEGYSLVVRTHPGNGDYTELLLLEDGEGDPLICFPNKDLVKVITVLEMRKENLEIAE